MTHQLLCSRWKLTWMPTSPRDRICLKKKKEPLPHLLLFSLQYYQIDIWSLVFIGNLVVLTFSRPSSSVTWHTQTEVQCLAKQRVNVHPEMSVDLFYFEIFADEVTYLFLVQNTTSPIVSH